MRGLVLTDQRRNEFIKVTDLIFGIRKPGAGFRKDIPVFPVGKVCVIYPFFQTAYRPFPTAVTDIGWLQETPAGFFFEIPTESIAHGTAPA